MAHKSADGAVVPARTWPFTASRIPASAYRTIHGACHTCDGVRGRLWLTSLPTALSYLCVLGRSRQAAYLHRHTGPFTAHVIPVTAYVTVHGEYRTATAYVAVYGTQGCRRRMSYLRRRTWPFTAHRVPASVYRTVHCACRTSAYVAVYGSQRCQRRTPYLRVRSHL